MAFQHPQTRRTRPTTHVYASHDNLFSLSRDLEPNSSRSESGGVDSSSDSGVLLFPHAHASFDEGESDWTNVTRRLDSQVGSSSETSRSAASESQETSSDRGVLPSHDGNGVFIRSLERVESLRGTSASESSEGGGGGTSDSIVLIDGAHDRGRRFSHATTTTTTESLSSFGEDDEEGNRITRGWELTEAALSRISTTERHRATANDEEEAELSAGFTSGSDNNDEGGREVRRKGRTGFESEMNQSLSALSAGFSSTRRRRGDNNTFSTSRSPSMRNRLPLAPVVGRSISPYPSSALSQTSSDSHFSIGSNGQRLYKSKRRHRQAAGREPEDGGARSASHKSRRWGMDRFERIEEEERARAERMKSVLEERVRENQVERAKKAVLMGKMMEIDPSTFPLLASTTNDDPTPTPSRASSPPPFARLARQELSTSSFDSIGQSYLGSKRVAEEVEEGNLTETEPETPSTARFPPPTDSGWVSSTSPPVFAPRSPPSASTLPRSHSRSTISPNPSFAVPRPRSVSLTSTHSHSHSRSLPSTLARTHQPSHEERVLLSPSSPSSSSTTLSSSTPWGPGELDSSLEFAMSVWKRFLRRLTRSSNTPPASPEISSLGLGVNEGRWGIEDAERGAGSGSEVGVY
ncbi:uncharacterized protein JCM6883_004505 [Sporobolomyces salmoneus]|uniref:uncharacterized protein n=1 Tax=Sporobolomyces salmoneus TaxID=183962 RepID=UPI0031701952